MFGSSRFHILILINCSFSLNVLSNSPTPSPPTTRYFLLNCKMLSASWILKWFLSSFIECSNNWFGFWVFAYMIIIFMQSRELHLSTRLQLKLKIRYDNFEAIITKGKFSIKWCLLKRPPSSYHLFPIRLSMILFFVTHIFAWIAFLTIWHMYCWAREQLFFMFQCFFFLMAFSFYCYLTTLARVSIQGLFVADNFSRSRSSER